MVQAARVWGGRVGLRGERVGDLVQALRGPERARLVVTAALDGQNRLALAVKHKIVGRVVWCGIWVYVCTNVGRCPCKQNGQHRLTW